jgi:hypothetical protein
LFSHNAWGVTFPTACVVGRWKWSAFSEIFGESSGEQATRHFRIFIRLCRRLRHKETDADYQHQGHDLIILSLVAALIARCPFAVVAHLPS